MKHLWMFAEYLHSPTVFNMLKRLWQNNSHEVRFLAIRMNYKVNDETDVYDLRVEQQSLWQILSELAAILISPSYIGHYKN